MVDLYKEHDNSSESFTEKCHISLSISEFFSCCGANDPNDFIDTNLAQLCCYTTLQIKSGCSQKAIDYIKYKSSNLHLMFLVPTIILAFEIFTSIIVIILIMRDE